MTRTHNKTPKSWIGASNVPELGLDYVWQVIQDAATRDWSSPRDWRVDQRQFGIRIWPGGHWQSSVDPAPDAAALFDLLLPLVARAGGFVAGQLGQSLDGRIATASGDSYYVTSHPGRIYLHRLRSVCDAVIVGAGTVAADDPRLTVRHVEGGNPVRVVVDPCGRLDPGYRIFDTSSAQTVHATGKNASPANDEVTHLPLKINEDGDISAQAVLDALAQRGLRRILVEGGADTLSRFLAAGALERLHLMVAPLIIGSGPVGLNLPEVDRLASVPRPRVWSYPLYPDTLFDIDLAHCSMGNPSTS